MNEFFKFLITQLLEYFNNDIDKLLEFIPKIVCNNYQNELEIIKVKNNKNNQTVEK